MAPPKLSTEILRASVALYVKHGGDINLASKEAGLTFGAFRDRIKVARQRLGEEEVPLLSCAHKSGRKRPAEVIAERVALVEAHGGNVAAAARAMGVSDTQMRATLVSAEQRSDWQPAGRAAAPKARRMPLPQAGDVRRYILTCAQNDTKLHEATWSALSCLAAYYGAEILISTFTYNQRADGSGKRGTGKEANSGLYDPRIEPFVCDEMVALAPSLIWNGNMNILPTATDPLSGMDNYNGRHSSVFPHAKVALKSVASIAGPAKLQYTTGTVTQANYIQKKAGQKAEFDHVHGALLVEVNSDGEWWARQLNPDSKGRLYDLDVVAMRDEDDDSWSVVPSIGAKAIVFGDVHVAQAEPAHVEAVWGERGMVAALRPALQVVHDVLDFESRSHHNRRDPHKMFALHAHGRESVAAEVRGVAEFLSHIRSHSPVVVVDSNHDRHLERWLKEADWRTDPVNAEFYLDAQKAFLAAARKGVAFNALKWAVSRVTRLSGVRFLRAGESYVICKDSQGGIELGLHGDQGPNGSRGSIRNLARIGRKVVIGHSHSAGIHNGAYQVGVTARLGMEYAAGAPSSWSKTDCVIHPNGKRQLVTWWRGRWRA